MKPFESMQEYSQVIRAFQRDHKKFYTNCFLMPDETAGLIEKRKLRFSTPGGMLLLLCDRTDYQNLYYYAAQDAPIPDFSPLYEETWGDQEIFFDVVYRETGPRTGNLPLEQLAASGKIRRYKCYQRMHISLQQLHPMDFSCGLCPGYRLMEDPPPYPRLISLWKAVLDERSSPLPDREQFKALHEKGGLFCVKSTASGQLSAAAAVHIQGRQGMLQHLAVLPEHRRQGLAESLCHMAILKGIQSGLRTVKLWVDKKNHPAIALYTKNGFVPEEMACDQFLIERRI